MNGHPFVFGVDLDGVCANYYAGFASYVADAKGVDASTLKPLTDYSDFSAWGIGSRDEFLQLHADAVEDGLFDRLPEIEGASRVLWKLSQDHDVWIRVITHRLSRKGTHAVSVASTVRWLDGDHLPRPLFVDGQERHALIPYRDICFIGDKPDVGADIYVDDAPYNVEPLREGGREVIVFDQPYNQHLPGPRAASWDEVYDIVVERLHRLPVAS